ncbi:MAG: sugar transferase [Spirochaeta sp.]|nr:sugar transferase [Spirochaeta sp.]
MDILLSLVATILFLPIGIPITIILRSTGEGEIFYLQRRIGKNRELFSVYKFATMLKNSPNIGSGDITVSGDPRVLPVGKFLRKTKLNEVPQVLNILFGSMSIVGPRPLTPNNFSYYTEENQEVIGRMRPGLTGIGSIVFRDEESIIGASDKAFDQRYKEDIAPYKAQLERWYYQHQGTLTDIMIILVTAWVVLRPESTVYRRIWKDLPPAPEGLFPA